MDRQRMREQANRLLRKRHNRGVVIEPHVYVAPPPIQTREVIQFNQVVIPPPAMLQTMKSVLNPSPPQTKPGEFKAMSQSSEKPKAKTGGCGGCRRRLGS
jgi:hypothetical protein